MSNHKSRQAGFTLVELSIVLVIIGLIIGGVLTGRQIMQNAQITNALNSIQAFQAQFQTYIQNYGAIPGDDISATTRFPNAVGVANGDGNGILGGTFDDNTGNSTAETRNVWADLRAADLVKNQVNNAVTNQQPSNPFGGIYGFQNTAFGTITANVLCLSNVPADAAEAIDSRLDDGQSNSGSIQATATVAAPGAAAAAPAANYGAAQTYTLCIRM